MNLSIKYVLLLYILIVVCLYIWKPKLFVMEGENKRGKFIFLISLFIIIAVICMYAKIMVEWLKVT